MGKCVYGEEVRKECELAQKWDTPPVEWCQLCPHLKKYKEQKSKGTLATS